MTLGDMEEALGTLLLTSVAIIYLISTQMKTTSSAAEAYISLFSQLSSLVVIARNQRHKDA